MGQRRFVLTTGGSFGDVIPYVALAKALMEHGERVVLATSPDYRMLVGAERIPFHPLGPELSFDRPDVAHLENRLRRFVSDTDHWVMDPLARNITELNEIVEDGDILVGHHIQLAAPAVAEMRGIPWVTTTYATWLLPVAERMPMYYPVATLGPLANRLSWRVFGQRMDRRYLPRLRDLWRGLGLRAPESFLSLAYSPLRTLLLTSPLFAAPKRFLPNVVVTGLLPWDRTRVWRRRRELERFLDAGEPPVVFRAPPHLEPGPFREIVKRTCDVLGVRGVLVDITAKEHGVQGRVYVDNYVPFTTVAERCSAGVHYGGHGTSAVFALAGKPAVITPTIIDQFENADVMVSLGAAIRTNWRRLTTDRLVRALDRAMTCTPGAIRLGARLREERGADTAVAMLRALG
jgi:rhamnosyltransferase subunit B